MSIETLPPLCEIDTLDELKRTVTDPRTTDVCLIAAHARQNAIAAGIMVVLPDGRIVPNPSKVPAQLDELKQSFHAWGTLMRTLSREVPRHLRRATFYRARLDDVVRYKRGTLKG